MDKIKKKIQKLLALQKGAEDIGSLEEAQNAAEKIRALVMKYQLDLDELKKSGEEKTRIGHSRIILSEHIPYNKTHGNWLISLVHIVAIHNFGSIIAIGKDLKVQIVDIWGEEYNIQVIFELTVNYSKQIIDLEKRRWLEVQDRGDKRNSFRRAYYKGAVAGLSHSFNAQKESLVKEHGERVNALIRTTDIELKEVRNNHYSNGIAKSRHSSNKSLLGASMGFADGKKLKASKQARVGNTKLLN